MKFKMAFLFVVFTIITVLTGCEPLTVLNPKGPQAARQAHDILLSIGIMSGIVVIVIAIFVYMLIKYRASNQPDDYEPPYIKGNKWVELICVGIPVIIVGYLSVVSVQSNYIVESEVEAYDHKEPLVIYASSSNWKWHFSYPEQNIETVNYLYIPTDRPLEFKLYSFGPITSFWIPQLGGQKYAMADMVTTLHLAASEPGEMVGKNANFSGKGTAGNKFNVTAVPQKEFEEWVDEVQNTAEPITEKEFNKLLEPGHLGQMTFTGTHLGFSPPPAHEHSDPKEHEKEHSKNKTGEQKNNHEDSHSDQHQHE